MPIWTVPTTWVDGQLVGASALNTHVRDNLNALMNPNNFLLQDTTHVFTTTATTLATLTSTALVVQGGGPVLVGGQMFLNWVGIGPTSGVLTLDIDGTQTNLSSGILTQGAQNIHFSMWVTGLSVASHTFNLKWKVDAGTTTGIISGAQLPFTFFAAEL